MTEKKNRILVLDDDELIIEILDEILETLGYSCTSTMKGSDTIQKYKEAFEQGNPFDLMILDLTVPDGVGGLEVIEGVKTFDPDVKAVISSGVSDEIIHEKYKEYGFVGLLQKPFNISALKGVLDSILK